MIQNLNQEQKLRNKDSRWLRNNNRRVMILNMSQEKEDSFLRQ